MHFVGFTASRFLSEHPLRLALLLRTRISPYGPTCSSRMFPVETVTERLKHTGLCQPHETPCSAGEFSSYFILHQNDLQHFHFDDSRKHANFRLSLVNIEPKVRCSILKALITKEQHGIRVLTVRGHRDEAPFDSRFK